MRNYSLPKVGQKVVIFDFCETLVDFQTADEFLLYIIEKNGMHRLKDLLKFYSSTLLYKVMGKVSHKFWLKNILLNLVKNISKKELEYLSLLFYEEKVKSSLILPVFNVLKKESDDGSYTVIISGGYECYLKHFFPEYVDCVIGTKLEYSLSTNQCCQTSPDCLGVEKLNRLDFISTYIEKDNSSVFSDSYTDMPLFGITNNSFLVRKNSTVNKKLLKGVKYEFNY